MSVRLRVGFAKVSMCAAGLISNKRSFKTSTLLRPTVIDVAIACLFILEWLIRSKSTKVMWLRPVRTRLSTHQLPTPPIPKTIKRFWASNCIKSCPSNNRLRKNISWWVSITSRKINRLTRFFQTFFPIIFPTIMYNALHHVQIGKISALFRTGNPCAHYLSNLQIIQSERIRIAARSNVLLIMFFLTKSTDFPLVKSAKQDLLSTTPIVCCRQTIVWSQQTMICSQQTIVCRHQTMKTFDDRRSS